MDLKSSHFFIYTIFCKQDHLQCNKVKAMWLNAEKEHKTEFFKMESRSYCSLGISLDTWVS